MVFIRNIWKACTTTEDGSLSETFKLVGSSEDSDRQTEASSGAGFSLKKPATEKDTDSFLDAIVVGDENSLRPVGESTKGSRQSDNVSQSHSQHTGSGINGGGMHHRVVEFGPEGASNYQGGVRSWLVHKAWPVVVEFFEPRLPENEEEFQSQQWHDTKLWAL